MNAPQSQSPAPMPSGGSAFMKGGCGCIVLFLVLATFTVIVGGSAHLDLGGVILLFVVGGVAGLIFRAIYVKGRKDERRK